MMDNILVKFEYEMTDDKIITLTAIESDNLKYTLHIDERHPIRSWLDIIRLRGMLMMYYMDESIHM
ncbi:hypothetical protein D3C79_1038290 [compost metagenome]